MACVFYGMPILIENNKPKVAISFLRIEATEGSVPIDPTRRLRSCLRQEREVGWYT